MKGKRNRETLAERRPTYSICGLAGYNKSLLKACRAQVLGLTALVLLLAGCQSTGKSPLYKERVANARATLSRPDATPKEKGWVLYKLALIYSANDERELAEKTWNEIITRPDTDSASKALADYELAQILEQRKQWLEAINAFRRFGDLYDTLSEDDRQGFDTASQDGSLVRARIGWIYEVKLRNMPEAEREFLAAVEHARSKNYRMKDEVTAILADFYFRRERYEVALEAYRRARTGYSEKGWEHREPIITKQIIVCLYFLGRQDEAIQEYQEMMIKSKNSRLLEYPESIDEVRKFLREKKVLPK